MKNKRKQYDLSLYDLFKDYTSNEEECDAMVNGAKKAFKMLKTDKEFRKEGL